MTPTIILALAATVAAIRSGRIRSLAPAARALCAFLLLDVYHHACRPLLDARRAGTALSTAEVWALRFDAWILAGGWCAVVAWLLRCDKRARPIHKEPGWIAASPERAFLFYGFVAVAVARLWPAAWTPLLIVPRFAVGALAWTTKCRGPRFTQGHCHVISPVDAPSLLIGQIVAACQVGAAAFLWSRWGDVRILSSACWAACAWVAWRAQVRSAATDAGP